MDMVEKSTAMTFSACDLVSPVIADIKLKRGIVCRIASFYAGEDRVGARTPDITHPSGTPSAAKPSAVRQG